METDEWSAGYRAAMADAARLLRNTSKRDIEDKPGDTVFPLGAVGRWFRDIAAHLDGLASDAALHRASPPSPLRPSPEVLTGYPGTATARLAGIAEARATVSVPHVAQYVALTRDAGVYIDPNSRIAGYRLGDIRVQLEADTDRTSLDPDTPRDADWQKGQR